MKNKLMKSYIASTKKEKIVGGGQATGTPAGGQAAGGATGGAAGGAAKK